MSFSSNLRKRLFNILKEEVGTTQATWKDYVNPDYDRQYAEDCLYHTIGPLTASPRWSQSWTSPSEPPPEFVPGGAAPRWDQNEVTYAFAGDPDPDTFFDSGNPRTPAYGRRGGSPMYRLAKKYAKGRKEGMHGSRLDKVLVQDLFSNGLVQLSRLMIPGVDQARSPFISFAISNLKGAMTGGLGAEKRTENLLRDRTSLYFTPDGQMKTALPEVAKTIKPAETSEQFEARRRKSEENRQAALETWKKINLVGIPGILKMRDPNALREAADVVKDDFRFESKPDISEGNPFGRYSADYYNVVNELASAYESNDEKRIEMAMRDLVDLREKAEGASTQVLGTYTGIADPITTPDRKTRIRTSSISGQRPSGETGETEEMQLASQEGEPTYYDDMTSSQLFINTMTLGLKEDLHKFFENTRYANFAKTMGMESGIGGRFTANQFRCLLRYFGTVAIEYPGKGNVRKNLDIPRESPNWWLPFEDTEIEPVPANKEMVDEKPVEQVEPAPTTVNEDMDDEGEITSSNNEAVVDGMWHSIWLRNGCPKMGAAAISREFTEEAIEFSKLKIAINPNRMPSEVKKLSISKTKINKDMTNGLMKFNLIAAATKEELDLNEHLVRSSNGMIIREHIADSVDRSLMINALDHLMQESTKQILTLISESLREKNGLIL